MRTGALNSVAMRCSTTSNCMGPTAASTGDPEVLRGEARDGGERDRPVWAWVTAIPRKKTPEQTRAQARWSRCAASIPACTLKTNALNGASTARSAPPRPLGGSRRGRQLHERAQQLRDADVRDGGGEEHRRRLTGEEGVLVVVGPVRREELVLLHGGVPNVAVRLQRRTRVEPLLRSPRRTPGGSLVADVPAAPAVEHAPEVTRDAHRPGQGGGPQADPLLDLVPELEGVAPGPVPLVDHDDHGDATETADLEEPQGLGSSRLAATTRLMTWSS